MLRWEIICSSWENRLCSRNLHQQQRLAMQMVDVINAVPKLCCHLLSAHEGKVTHLENSFTFHTNDAILIDICKRRSLKLITHDGDFHSGGIEILTTNPKLLKACL